MERDTMPPHRRSAAAAKRAIQETALELFIAYGFEGTSLDEIAERLGVTRQAVLYHFGKKEDLLLSVVLPGLEAIITTLDSLPVDDPPTRKQCEKALVALVEVMCEHRDAITVLTRFTNEKRVAHLAPKLLELNQKGGRLFGGSAIATDPVLRVRVVATMSALSGIMGSRLNVPLTTPAERRALVDGCLAMLYN
jgi:AcrR family transcriptional regulator